MCIWSFLFVLSIKMAPSYAIFRYFHYTETASFLKFHTEAFFSSFRTESRLYSRFGTKRTFFTVIVTYFFFILTKLDCRMSPTFYLAIRSFSNKSWKKTKCFSHLLLFYSLIHLPFFCIQPFCIEFLNSSCIWMESDHVLRSFPGCKTNVV